MSVLRQSKILSYPINEVESTVHAINKMIEYHVGMPALKIYQSHQDTSPVLSSRQGCNHTQLGSLKRSYFQLVRLHAVSQGLMDQGKDIPEAVHWIIIRLSALMTVEAIAMYTDVDVWSVGKILEHFRRTGDVNVTKKPRPQLYKSLCNYDIYKSLCNYDIQAWELVLSPLPKNLIVSQHMFAMLNDTPDLYLDELKQELQDICGVAVSKQTIWRTLIECGCRMKKVHTYDTFESSLLILCLV